VNLHQIAPPQTRYVRAPIEDIEPNDYCEWDTFTIGTECQNLMVEAIVDTTDRDEGYHGVHGSCVAHLCADHIEIGFQETINPV
jgi:hypothetical protein